MLLALVFHLYCGQRRLAVEVGSGQVGMVGRYRTPVDFELIAALVQFRRYAPAQQVAVRLGLYLQVADGYRALQPSRSVGRQRFHDGVCLPGGGHKHDLVLVGAVVFRIIVLV